MSNSDNPKKGKVFQQKVLELAKNKFQKSFIEEKVVKMGNPEKEHRFDCVASDSSVIIFAILTCCGFPTAIVSIYVQPPLFGTYA